MDGLTLSKQLREMRPSVDPETGATLFRHHSMTGVPDRVVEGEGYTLEFIGPTLSASTSLIQERWGSCWLRL